MVKGAAALASPGVQNRRPYPRLSESRLNVNVTPSWAVGVSIRIATEQPRARGGPLRYPRPWASPALRCPSTHLAASSQSTRSRGKRQTEKSSGRSLQGPRSPPGPASLHHPLLPPPLVIPGSLMQGQRNAARGAGSPAAKEWTPENNRLLSRVRGTSST